MKEAKIELACLRFSSNRAYGGDGEIQILAEDIKRNGLINPITVKYAPDDGAPTYEVVAGRRRVLAVTQLGWREITCRILEGTEIEHADEIAGAENINRLAMHPLDEAEIFSKLLENGRPIEELSKQYDRSVSAIWQRVQLLSLGDDIKKLFRDGKISLHAAAMLKSLDQKQQSAFYNKFHEAGNISIWEVKGFISKTRHDKLYSCIAGKDCAGCEKRTFYNDKALFPELDDEDDLCLDHECYMEKWRKLLSGKIKTIKAGNKSHAEADIILCDDDGLARVFGKTITVDGTEYKVIKSTWNNRADDKPSKAAKPCFEIDFEDKYSGNMKFACVPKFWKEPAKEKEQPDTRQKNPFLPMVKLLDMPEEEGKQTAAALWAEHKPKQTWETCKKADDIERKVKSVIFDKLLDIIVKKPDDDGDIDRFLNHFLDRTNNKEIIKKFAGSVKTPEIKKLSFPKLCAALYASTFNHHWAMPDIEGVMSGKKSEVAIWTGVSTNQLKEMYKKELAALMPKVEVKAATEKAAPVKKECDMCKSAHPECSGCCATCKDTCNSQQICRKAKEPAAKKTTRKKLPSAKHITAVQAKKKSFARQGKGKKE
jgi:ParB/RepB/Spo0J family partition protein